MKRALILVEGQTEERFVKQVLSDHLISLNLYITPTLLTTKVVKSGPNFKGGVTKFQKFESDLRRLLAGAGDGALVTSMLDYYRLPDDFPGMNNRPAPINLFVRDMPRLSVDLDLVFPEHTVPRAEALKRINEAIRQSVARLLRAESARQRLSSGS